MEPQEEPLDRGFTQDNASFKLQQTRQHTAAHRNVIMPRWRVEAKCCPSPQIQEMKVGAHNRN